ncbi:MAG: DUF255 domain-containing protein [Thermoanaerobaculia bacterium]
MTFAAKSAFLVLAFAAPCHAMETTSTTPPGAQPRSAAFDRQLQEAVAAKGPAYVPRTEHLQDDGGPVYVNRLIFEDSPYLIQHAHNPVDWYSWGEEAFEKAKAENKPIFLSIGYSTCHWCHVMERESFDDEEVALVLNQSFIAIKVDRERRPDVDEIYMTAVHLRGKRGGWPLSSFLTPEGKPFFGATYFPKANFLSLLNQIETLWSTRREALVADAERLAAAVAEATSARGKAEQVGASAVDQAVAQILSRHDSKLGGFGRAPKFPNEPDLLLLLQYALRSADQSALQVTLTTLRAMARGGIYDQIGGGFHRYSTDARWLVPHFEKMLYNQAHLARAYTEAWLLTGELELRRVVEQTLDYVLREMTAPEGGFYSATDADNPTESGEMEEGGYFTWTPAEIAAALTDEEARLAIEVYGVTEAGNFEHRNILHRSRSEVEAAEKLGLGTDAFLRQFDTLRKKLHETRSHREPPLRDDKVLTAWNGMMITALAQGAEALGESRYLEAAVRAADFLWQTSRRPGGRLWRIHLDGSSSVEAIQEDYAYFLEALLAVADGTGEERWLERAAEVADGMTELFWDEAGGGFFMSAAEHDPNLIARPKSPQDGAIPSGNSVAVRALVHLASRTGERRYSDRAASTLAAFSESISKRPSAFSYMLMGSDDLLHDETGPLRYAAGGKVAVRARLKRETPEAGALQLTVDLDIADGWHVNAAEPLQENLVATTLSLPDNDKAWSLGEVSYPAPIRKHLSFQQEELAVLEGRVSLSASLVQSGQAAATGVVVPLSLRLQACNDRLCLKPEDIELRVPLPAPR